jgi:hypothetical protein
MARRWITVDGNDAPASVAYRSSDIIATYPVAPSSGMGETGDAIGQGTGDRFAPLPGRAHSLFVQRRLALYQELAGRPGGHA